jgi:predicted signal transduction protein with EAL and GGDEF domain
MKWFLSYALGSHASEWLALGVMIVFTFALCITSLKVVFWLLTRRRDTDAAESEYWRIHGGG